ncbi:helix-turn-helix domain-containing protein [bacterium]|jgi:putative transcriptional regulator|nr:helix-turn-helix domain-containing protein [bacterium]
MKENDIKRTLGNNQNNLNGKTDWDKLDAMSEEAIEKNAIEDEDSYDLKDSDLSKFKRVDPIKKVNVKKIRTDLGLSQQRFAMYFGFSPRTIQEWEQGRREPTGAIRNFLTVISYNPDVVQDALLDKRDV